MPFVYIIFFKNTSHIIYTLFYQNSRVFQKTIYKSAGKIRRISKYIMRSFERVISNNPEWRTLRKIGFSELTISVTLCLSIETCESRRFQGRVVPKPNPKSRESERRRLPLMAVKTWKIFRLAHGEKCVVTSLNFLPFFFSLLSRKKE